MYTFLGCSLWGPQMPNVNVWLWKNPSIPQENANEKNAKNKIAPEYFFLVHCFGTASPASTWLTSLWNLGMRIPNKTKTYQNVNETKFKLKQINQWATEAFF